MNTTNNHIIHDYHSPHWMAGGTGVTNLSPSKVSRYQQAIEEFGDDDLFLSDIPMDLHPDDSTYRRQPQGGYSFHHKKSKDLSAFYDVLEKIECGCKNS